jgi:hypothetical protein
MPEKFTSDQLARELPRPLLNFLWYLWETYHSPWESECRVTLRDGGADGLRFEVSPAGVSVAKDFGCRKEAEIAIRRYGSAYFMEYY